MALVALCLVALIFSHLAAFCIGARAVTKRYVVEMIDFIMSLPRGSVARSQTVATCEEMAAYCNNLKYATGAWIWLQDSLRDERIQ